MHIHILGICGTFMGSLAVLAKQLGYEVSGSDQNVYPPMSTQLKDQGISLCSGFDPANITDDVDMVVIGNACSRGNPAVEYVLDNGLSYSSGPQWLAEHVLKDRWVLGVAGTHGKTTTTSMLAWILEYAGLNPGYLIGGVPKNFNCSARLGESPFFVIEADEYDSAFFDKRSKFIHYKSRTTIMGNLEFDHADIFADLGAIQTQFHHLVKTIAQNGLIISPAGCENLVQVFESGVWCERQEFELQPAEGSLYAEGFLPAEGSLLAEGSLPAEGSLLAEGSLPAEGSLLAEGSLPAEGSLLAEGSLPAEDSLPTEGSQSSESSAAWQVKMLNPQGGRFSVVWRGKEAQVSWNLLGRHNVQNAAAAIAAAAHVGVDLEISCAALEEFAGVKRRLELVGEVRGIQVFDDFAHHPTAIKTTLDGMRAELENDAASEGGGKQGGRLIAVVEARSNTMKMGYHQQALGDSLIAADLVVWYDSESTHLDLEAIGADSDAEFLSFTSVAGIIEHLVQQAISGDRIVIMSNGGFEGIHKNLCVALASA